ncbi:MAG: sulfatase-like hydrolase/transferase [Vicinamibacterales bacterium]
MRRLLLVATLVVATTLVAAGGGWLVRSRLPPVPAGACARCNFLLVTVDTLRRDRVGAFGGPAGLTPTIDRLALAGVRFRRAYSSVPLTLPSHASILTAVSPPVHGIRANGLYRLSDGLPTLATVLRGAGYRTGAFVGAFVLDARFGLNRDFDEYDDRYGEAHAGDESGGAERRGEDVVAPAAAWILQGASRASDPWFAWVHLYDPHEPYRAPEAYTAGRAPYDAEVAYADAMLGRLIEGLSAAGQMDRTLVMVAADHGESLGEHGERTHGVFAYDATLRVPWVVWLGPRLAPRDADGLARLIDLAPTALELLGVPPPASFEGRSLLASVNGTEPDSRTAYFEAMDASLTRNWAPLTGIVSGQHKLVDLPVAELYDLAADPAERTNLYGREAERARTLGALLKGVASDFAARGSAAEVTTLDSEARQRLQALGYVASSVSAGARVYTDADDPKNLIGVAEELNRGLSLFRSGALSEGLAIVSGIARDHPTFPTAHGTLAAMLHDTGDLRGAIETLEGLVNRGLADQSVLLVLGGYLQEAGAMDRSIGLLEALVAAHPDYADAYNSLGVSYSRLGRRGQAAAAFAKVLALDPTSATAYLNIGADALAASDLASADAALRRALELDPKLPSAHNALAIVAMRQGRTSDAIEHWREAVALNPGFVDALYNLGLTLLDARRPAEARPYLERFVAAARPQRYAADIARVRAILASLP